MNVDSVTVARSPVTTARQGVVSLPDTWTGSSFHGLTPNVDEPAACVRWDPA